MNGTKSLVFIVCIFSFFVVVPLYAAPKKIAIFVNGNMDCCAWEMNKTMEAFRKLGITVYDTPWNSLSLISGNNSENQSPKVTTGATTNFVNHMNSYVSRLPSGTELYLIGHSFGGDSILKFLDQHRRTKVKFKLVAILDAVAFGGKRSNNHHVSSNVDFFFNRWQTNAPWPVDIAKSGNVRCSAKTCDQKEQNISKHPNGKARKTKCGQLEACPGKKIIYQGIKTRIEPGYKQTRLHHQYVPTDPYIEEQIIAIAKRGIYTANCSGQKNIEIRVGSRNKDFGHNKAWKTCTGYKTIFQSDGNFVVYNPSGRAVWASNTHGKGGRMLAMQTDGNLVIYASGGKPIWDSKTHGNPGAFLAIQQDGNVVIYTRNGKPIWSTGTNGK